jgi:hypothetical protein
VAPGEQKSAFKCPVWVLTAHPLSATLWTCRTISGIASSCIKTLLQSLSTWRGHTTSRRYGILRTLHRWNLRGWLPLFILSFLQDHHFRVHLGNVFSALYSQENGVPQGSVLTATLFAVAISVMVNTVCASVTTLYVDDVTICFSSRSVVTIEHWLQLVINCICCNGPCRMNFPLLQWRPSAYSHNCRVCPPPHLYLNNRAPPFAPSVKFLGLLLDSKLTWEPHLWWLWVKCERSHRILQILIGSSWGGDQMVMLWLYHTLICSKTDYGGFVYGSATKSKLSVIDPIHHTGIHLATGAFHTNRIESLYVESGELSLSLRRNLLLCSYVAKLATQPDHPWCSVVFHALHDCPWESP